MCVFLLHVCYKVCRSLSLWLLKLSGQLRDSSVICCFNVLLPWSLFSRGCTHYLILSSCMSTCWNWLPREPFGLGYAHHTMEFIPPLPHPLQPTRLSATNSWLAFPLSLGPRATIHCQQPGDIGLKSLSVWIPLVASLCSWHHTQTPPQDD